MSHLKDEDRFEDCVKSRERLPSIERVSGTFLVMGAVNISLKANIWSCEKVEVEGSKRTQGNGQMSFAELWRRTRTFGICAKALRCGPGTVIWNMVSVPGL
jgi:hypothetical protein